MSLRKRRNLLLLAVFHFIMLAAFLPGCKEGESNTPASSLFFKFDPRQIDNAKTNYNLKGFVFDLLNNNSPVAQANVTVDSSLIVPLSASSSYLTTVDASSTYLTDTSGYFYVSEKQIGTYSVKVSKNGYCHANSDFRVDSEGKATPNALLLPLVQAQGDYGSITGRVYYKAGQNPASITVFLFSYPQSGDLKFIASTSITANGFFNFYVPARKHAIYVAENDNPPTVTDTQFYPGSGFIDDDYNLETASNTTKYLLELGK